MEVYLLCARSRAPQNYLNPQSKWVLKILLEPYAEHLDLWMKSVKDRQIL